MCKAQLEIALHDMGAVGLQDKNPIDKTTPTVTAARRMTLTVLRALRRIQEAKEVKMPNHGNSLTVQLIRPSNAELETKCQINLVHRWI